MSISLAYNMDCMEALREMPDNAFDLAVVDVPYGIGEGGQNRAPEESKPILGKAKATLKHTVKFITHSMIAKHRTRNILNSLCV